eukprot:Gb_19977 [translate_table: standard]
MCLRTMVPIEKRARKFAPKVYDEVRCLDNEFHFYTFHVVYNNSYKVPMLLFRGRCIDGQPLEWEDIEKDFPSYSRQLHKDSRWTFLTQEEHPYLNQPWYSLHPCGTSKWMGFLFSSRSEVRVPPAIMFGQSVGLSKIKLQRKDNGQPPPLVENSSVCSSSNNNIVASTYVVTLREVIVHQYLIAWLSVVGQAVGLKVPFEIAKFCS